MKTNSSDEVFRLISDRAPNFLDFWLIQARLSSFSDEEINEALKNLVEKGKIILEEEKLETGEVRKLYKVNDSLNVPIRKIIQVGNVSFPRLLRIERTKYFPERLNESIERLAEYSNSLEGRFKEMVLEEQKKYWGNVVGVLGVVVSVLALIITGLPKISTNPEMGFWDVVCLNFAQLLPLAVVLTFLVLALRWVIK